MYLRLNFTRFANTTESDSGLMRLLRGSFEVASAGHGLRLPSYIIAELARVTRAYLVFRAARKSTLCMRNYIGTLDTLHCIKTIQDYAPRAAFLLR